MPRSANSRKSMIGAQTQDAEVEEVMPGRLTQTQWMEMLRYEETEETVAELMEQLVRRVMDGCFRADVKEQLASYTAHWVKNHLVKMVEQHFLCRDEGDGPEDVLTEDSEPPPAEPDAWAQGCVPLVTRSPPLRPISPQEVAIVQEEAKDNALPECSLRPDISPKLSKTSKTSPKPVMDTIYKVHRSFPQPKTDLKKHNQGPMHAKPSKFLPPLSRSTENKTSPGNSLMSASLNLPSRHKAIQKLDPASLPDHCLFPKYEIVDNNSNTKHKNIRDNKAMQKHTKQLSEWTATSQRNEADVRPKYEATSRLLRLETMALSKGVTLSNAQSELNQVTARTPPVKLKPIRNEPAVFKFPVEQFVGDPLLTPQSQP